MVKNRVFEIVTQHAREVMPSLSDHAFQPSESLKDLGANSIDRAEIVMMTLESLSIRMPLIELASAENLSELTDLLSNKLETA